MVENSEPEISGGDSSTSAAPGTNGKSGHEVLEAAEAWERASAINEEAKTASEAARARARDVAEAEEKARKAVEEAHGANARAASVVKEALDKANHAKQSIHDRATAAQQEAEAARKRAQDARTQAESAGHGEIAFQAARHDLERRTVAFQSARAQAVEATQKAQQASENAEGIQRDAAAVKKHAETAKTLAAEGAAGLADATQSADVLREHASAARSDDQDRRHRVSDIEREIDALAQDLEERRAAVERSEVAHARARELAEQAAHDQTQKSDMLVTAKSASEKRELARQVAQAAQEVAEKAEDEERCVTESQRVKALVPEGEKGLKSAHSDLSKAQDDLEDAAKALAAIEAELSQVTAREAEAQARAKELAELSEHAQEAAKRAVQEELEAVLASQNATQTAEAAREVEAAAEKAVEQAKAEVETREKVAIAERIARETAAITARAAEQSAAEAEATWAALRAEALAAHERAVHAQSVLDALVADGKLLAAELKPSPDESRRRAARRTVQAVAATDGKELDDAPPVATFRLVVTTKDGASQAYTFEKDSVSIGRDATCDLKLDDKLVSRKHADVRRNENLFALVDHGTSNGTFLNGKKISGLSLLNDGDGIGIGDFRIRFESDIQSGALPIAEKSDGKVAKVGTMVVRLSNEPEKKAQDETRIRGYVVLPRPKSADLKLFVSEVFQIGKAPECDLALKGWFVPRKAAMIVRGQDRYTLVNVGAAPASVLVNDSPVNDRTPLGDGDKVEIYGEKFAFTIASPVEAAAARAASRLPSGQA